MVFFAEQRDFDDPGFDVLINEEPLHNSGTRRANTRSNITYRIQTDARVITGNKDRDKKPRPQAEVFYFEVFISCNHEGEVCILFKYMPMKTDYTFDCFHVSFLSDSTCLSTPTPRQTLRVELSRSRFEASQELLCLQMPSCPFLSIDRRCTDRYSVQPLTIPFFVLLWPSLYLLFLLVPSVFISVSSIHW